MKNSRISALSETSNSDRSYKQSRRGFLTTMTVSGISIGVASSGSLVSTISSSSIQASPVSAYLAHSNGVDEALGNYPGYAHAISYSNSALNVGQTTISEAGEKLDPQLFIA